MYTIAICDDEEMICTELDNLLISYENDKNIKIETEIFTSGENLQKEIKNGQVFDLIFLDIELGKMNGVDVGNMIREQTQNEYTQIVYISSKEKYAMQLFKIRPLDFLIKPIKKEMLYRVMDLYLRLNGVKNKYFEYQIGKRTCRVLEKDIRYFQSNAKKVQMYTIHGTEEFYGKLSVIQKQLNPNKFWTVHKSYIINLDFIAQYRVDEMMLLTGEAIPISQVYRNQIKEKLMNLQIEKRSQN